MPEQCNACACVLCTVRAKNYGTSKLMLIVYVIKAHPLYGVSFSLNPNGY